MEVEDMHYTTARRMRYVQEITIPAQIGAIVDELKAMRPLRDYGKADSFTALLERIDAIKADIPKN